MLLTLAKTKATQMGHSKTTKKNLWEICKAHIKLKFTRKMMKQQFCMQIPGNPGNPSRPAGPGAPGAPSSPASPTGPGSPVSPRAPGRPAAPGKPGRPGSPFNPGTPGTNKHPRDIRKSTSSDKNLFADQSLFLTAN